MKFIKIMLIVFLSFILLGVLSLMFYKYVYVDYLSLTPSEKYFYKELKKKIKAGETEIYLKDLTNFEWENLLLKNIYYEPGGVIPKKYKFSSLLNDKEIKFSLDPMSRCWVFLKEKTIVKVIRRKSFKVQKINFYYLKFSELKSIYFSKYLKIVVLSKIQFDRNNNLKYKEIILKEGN